MTSAVANTEIPQPKEAVLRYLYVPGVAIVSVYVAAEPASPVQTVKGEGDLSQLYVGPAEAGTPVVAGVVLVTLTVPPAQIFVTAIAPPLFVVENTSTSTVVLTAALHPNVAVLRYLYIPDTAITSLKVAAAPGRAVQTVKGEGDLSQLYVGPAEAGTPVVAEVVFVMLTVPPGQISVPAIAPAL